MLQMELWKRWQDSFDRIHAISDSLALQLSADGINSQETMFLGAKHMPARQPLDATPLAAYVGRFSSEKGIDVLCHAFKIVLKQLPHSRLLLAGDGPQRQLLEGLVKELGIERSVDFLGHLSHDQMCEKLSKVWVQVMPSLMQEPFGLATGEALTRGIPVVASNCGGPSEMVCEGQTGYLVPPGDVERLASRLLDILSDRTKAQRMGDQARQKALRTLTVDSYVDRLIEIYEELAGARRPLASKPVG
jgi:Glycosyltransferase